MTRERDPHVNAAAAGLVLSAGTGAAVSLPPSSNATASI
jgi:hypothetical protein